MLSVSQLCKSIVSGVQFPRTAVHPLPVAADSARWLGFTPYTTRDPTSIYLSTLYLAAFAAYSAGVGARKSRV